MRQILTVLVLMVALMSGILSLARELLAIYDPARVQPASLFWRCVWIAFILSAAVAWYEEHSKLLTLQRKLASPDFNLESSSEWWGDDSHNLRMVFSGTLTNPIGPASAAINWQASLVFPNETVNAEIVFPPSEDVKIPLQGEPFPLILKASSNWLALGSNPIQTGGSQSGWLQLVFRNKISEDLYTYKPKIEISCADVATHKRHVFTHTLGERRGITIPGK